MFRCLGDEAAVCLKGVLDLGDASATIRTIGSGSHVDDLTNLETNQVEFMLAWCEPGDIGREIFTTDCTHARLFWQRLDDRGCRYALLGFGLAHSSFIWRWWLGVHIVGFEI